MVEKIAIGIGLTFMGIGVLGILYPKVLCTLLGHKWSMYAGFDQVRVHPSAICKRCDERAS